MPDDVARPLPPVGGVIPDNVQDVPGRDPFIYPYGWQPGDRLTADEGTVADALDQEVRAGRITPDQARQSAQASGLTNYTPPTV